MTKLDIAKAQPTKVVVGGQFFCKLIRNNGDIETFISQNLVLNQGLDTLLATTFTGQGQVPQWYLAPFSNNYAPVSTDTAATLPGNAGENTTYTSSTRVAYSGTENNQQVTNAGSLANFTFNATVTIYGAFLTSSATKLSTSGVAFAAAQFASPKNVESGDQLLLGYQFAASST